MKWGNSVPLGTDYQKWYASADADHLKNFQQDAPGRAAHVAKVEKCSGNVYADLGFPDAGEMALKAQLALNIARTIKRRKLTQKDAARIMGLSQAKVSEC